MVIRWCCLHWNCGALMTSRQVVSRTRFFFRNTFGSAMILIQKLSSFHWSPNAVIVVHICAHVSELMRNNTLKQVSQVFRFTSHVHHLVMLPFFPLSPPHHFQLTTIKNKIALFWRHLNWLYVSNLCLIQGCLICRISVYFLEIDIVTKRFFFLNLHLIHSVWHKQTNTHTCRLLLWHKRDDICWKLIRVLF